MAELRGGLIGCGFFARNHLHGWREVCGAAIVAVADIDLDRARACAREFGIAAAYGDAEAMLQRERLDFVDIVTQPSAHAPLIGLAARHRVHVICQKPLAPSLEEARRAVWTCREAGVRLMVHENFRWQAPMRALKRVATGSLGTLFFGRIVFRSAFDVFRNQPYLAREPRFIIYDLGVHLLDLARFFFGEFKQLTCQVQRIHPGIQGEDVATILLAASSGATCVVELSYASKLERELFPQTLVHLEGTGGSATVGPDYLLTQVADGTVQRYPVWPRLYPWSTPPLEAIQESVVAIQQHWVDCLARGVEPETCGDDNLKTLGLVFGAYHSAETGLPYRVAGDANKGDRDDP